MELNYICEASSKYYVIYKSFRPFLSFFGDLYSKVLVICIRFKASAQHYKCQLSHLIIFSSYIFLNKKDAHGPNVFFAKLVLNPSMSQESILTIKYRPKLFVGAFKVKHFHWTVVLACEFSSNHSFAHLCGICRAQIKSEGFQHLELVVVPLVQLMWPKIT